MQEKEKKNLPRFANLLQVPGQMDDLETDNTANRELLALWNIHIPPDNDVPVPCTR